MSKAKRRDRRSRRILREMALQALDHSGGFKPKHMLSEEHRQRMHRAFEAYIRQLGLETFVEMMPSIYNGGSAPHLSKEYAGNLYAKMFPMMPTAHEDVQVHKGIMALMAALLDKHHKKIDRLHMQMVKNQKHLSVAQAA